MAADEPSTARTNSTIALALAREKELAAQLATATAQLARGPEGRSDG